MEIWYAPVFDKTFKKLDKSLKNLCIQEIQKLKDDPYAGEPLTGTLDGLRSLHIKAHNSNCRIVYKISRDKTKVVVIAAGTHKMAYEWLKLYITKVLKRPNARDTIFEP